MATAVVEERQLLKSLRWWDGFTIALCQPGFLLGSLLFAYGSLGVTGATVLWGISAAVSLMNVWVYSELAMMFPGRSGGISLYANETYRPGVVGTLIYFLVGIAYFAIVGRHRLVLSPEEEFALTQGQHGDPAKEGYGKTKVTDIPAESTAPATAPSGGTH